MTPQTTVLPPAAPARANPWTRVLRAVAAVVAGAAIGAGGKVVLALAAFVLLPSCSHGPASPVLMVVTGAFVVVAAVVPVAVAGLRLWWVGVPAAALAVAGVLPMATSLLTETQSGFCF